MKRIFIKTITIFIFSILLFSCTEDNEPNQVDYLDGYSKLTEGFAIGAKAKVEIWGQKNFFMGYNKLIAVLYDSLNPTVKINDAHIYFKPEMTMNMMGMNVVHAAPVENPNAIAVNDLFPGAVAFVMPTAMDGSWKLRVRVHNHLYDKFGEAEFDIVVDNPEVSVMKVFTSLAPDNRNLVLSIIEPSKPKVGINDIEFTLHHKASMMDWPADDSYTIEITPEMPSMGHGSPNNVNPVSSGTGHYKGKVNFTMTGEWRVNVLVKKDGQTISEDLFFIINF